MLSPTIATIEDGIKELKEAPAQLQDEPRPQVNKLEEVNLSADLRVNKSVFVSTELPNPFKHELIKLLHEYQDVFAWTYQEMPGLEPTLVTHKLATLPEVRPVKQPPRNFNPEIQLKIKAEIEKLIRAGFIQTCIHPQWLADIVLVQKKNGQIRCCADYQELNKACPKGDFP